ncbi:uncharacterized protein N7496_007653 [Penicillium cataractarum]|uniref:Zn(2)-C6 fungal-type domain-containing protein n=1 Tax=Penicillium cataractarum TaxID=2100454 RepID=A0A9W9RWX0_9EURO|nr:uncharacterized protein N7496_007653 [Penicillium cataractarum]KAJ5367893.1 hypothetical protein N7496_007653 [Penicillium cataractarum]
MPSQPLSTPESTIGQRRLRKGTHSCWECRRRKIRCQFPSTNAAVCVQCSLRGSVCRRQDSGDLEQPSRRNPSHGQRLDQLEQLMQRLVDRIIPDENFVRSDASERQQTISTSKDGNDLLPHNTDTPGTRSDETPVSSLLGPSGSDYTSPSFLMTGSSDRSGPSSGACGEAKGKAISSALHALFPPQHAIDTIVQCSPGALFLTKFFLSSADLIAGKTVPPASITIIPQIDDHPSLLARRLLQLAVCMQQLSPSFDERILGLRSPIVQTMVNILSLVSDLVTCNDDLAGTPEGLECLILQGIWHANAGNLRKSWLTFRRALSLAQLMCIDSGSFPLVGMDSSCTVELQTSASLDRMWYIIIAYDRSLSLLLGLQIGSLDNSFASDEAMKMDSPEDRLQKLHTVISARIVQRNLSKTAQTYVTTQAIDCDLDTYARSMGQDWWVTPITTASETSQQVWEQTKRLMIQIDHHSLLVMLHLPYLLREPTEDRYIYSKLTCIRSSREILHRFIILRNDIESPNSCRHIDYSCSIAAMTLLLSYLVNRDTPTGATKPTVDQREEDSALVLRVKHRLEEIVLLNQDGVSRESAHIISQLLPVLEITKPTSRMSLATGKGNEGTVRLNVPYLGIVNIAIPTQGNATHHGNVAETIAEPISRCLPTLSITSTYSSGTGSELGDLGASSHENCEANLFLQVDPPGPEDDFDFDLTAEADYWPFQGVETNFWSLINGGMPRP